MNENKLVNVKALQQVGKGLKDYIDSSITDMATKEYVNKKLDNLSNNTVISYDETEEELLMDTSFINISYDEEDENLSILGSNTVLQQ